MTKRTAPKAALLSAAVLALGLAGCVETINTRGFQANEAQIESVTPGVDTRASVLDKLGTPSTSATFAPEVWYYISSIERTEAFFAPEVVSRQIVAVEFTDEGTVTDIRRYEAKDGRIFAFNDRETPTRGRELTVLQQLFGNVGRGVPLGAGPGGGGGGGR